jgi:hypothetical protein
MSALLIAEDERYPAEDRPRIIFDPQSQTVCFERCHQSRSFLAVGVEPFRVCPFRDIRSVTDFLSGDHRGTAVKAVLAAGPLVHSHSTAADLASYFISTSTGRCRVFSHWQNFAELREALAGIVPVDARPHWSENPRLIPLFAIVLIAIVAGLIYWLL